MSATPPLPLPAEGVSKPAGMASPLMYEPPSLVELGTLKDLTAAGSFIDPT